MAEENRHLTQQDLTSFLSMLDIWGSTNVMLAYYIGIEHFLKSINKHVNFVGSHA